MYGTINLEHELCLIVSDLEIFGFTEKSPEQVSRAPPMNMPKGWEDGGFVSDIRMLRGL